MIVENINKALFTSTGQVEDSKETQEILGRFMSPQISIKLVTGFIKKTKKKKALKKSASDSARLGCRQKNSQSSFKKCNLM